LTFNLPLKLKNLIGNAGSQAEALEWLSANRLLSLTDLLRDRGLISDELAALSKPLGERRALVSEATLAHETRVMAAFAAAGIASLALKGCLLAYSVYPDPRRRWRADLDVLIAPDSIERAREALGAQRYRPIHTTPGGTPIRQETWFRDDGEGRQYVDVHWDLRDHPLLRDRFSFAEQYRASVELPALAPGARGQGNVHALLNSVMHWYDDLYEHRQPLAWLLDNDLLWRSMDEDQRRAAAELAIDRGIAGLLADVLERTRAVFDTPISDDMVADLDEAGRDESATRLIAAAASRYRSFWLALKSEPGWGARFSRLRHSLFPPAAHMRERYPGGSRLGLPGLYLRRIWKRVR